MSEPSGSRPPGLLDRLTEFFKSLAGVITALVLLGGAVAGAVAFINGRGDGGTTTGRTPPVSPSAPPAPSPPSSPVLPGPASVFSNRDSGPGGTTVLVSGEGFDPGERVVLRFHTDQIGSTTANGDGKFSNVAVTIPTTLSEFAPRQFELIATGQSSIRTATTPFTLTG
jgi:hypothetical protein